MIPTKGKASILLIPLLMIVLAVFAFSSCSSKRDLKVQNKIERMTDEELLGYYDGLNARIKDVSRDVKSREEQADTESEQLVGYDPFYLGGNVHQLYRIRKMVLREMRLRNLSPGYVKP